MDFPRHTPYAAARFDGALLFTSLQAGIMVTGKTQSPIVRYEVRAGAQNHPVWSLDRLALVVYCYSEIAKAEKLEETDLQVSVTASWISTNRFSNLIATHIVWHTSSAIRETVSQMLAHLEDEQEHVWPLTEIRLPVQESLGA